jgi:GH24 family phage-related lysozyme (muramidase)
MADYDFSPPSESEKKEIQSKYDLAPPTSEELASLKDETGEYSTGQQAKDLARTVAQGATLGFSDEAIALARSILGKKTYQETVKEEREALEKYSKEHPYIATGAEIVGGLAPALLTGGGSAIAEAGAAAGAKAAAMAAAKEGAKFGAATALGKTEQLAEKPMEAAKEVALGTVTGGLLGGAIGGGVELAKKLPSVKESVRKILPRTVSAYETALERGELVGSLEASKSLSESADALSNTLQDARKLGSERIKKLVQEKTDEGVRIAGKEADEIAANLEQLKEHIVTKEEGLEVKNLLDKYNKWKASVEAPKAPGGPTAEGVYRFTPEELQPAVVATEEAVAAEGAAVAPKDFEGFTPSELQQVKSIVANVGRELADDPNVSSIIKKKFVSTGDGIRNSIKTALGEDYNTLNQAQTKLYQAFEELINKGQGVVLDPVTGRKSGIAYNQGQLSKRPQRLRDAVKNTVDRLKILTTGPDEARTGFDKFKTAMIELFKKEQDLIDAGVIEKSESYFSKAGIGDPEEFFKLMERVGDVSAARYGEIGERSIGDPSLGFLKDALGYITSEKGISKAAGYAGLGVRKLKGSPVVPPPVGTKIPAATAALETETTQALEKAKPLPSKTSETLGIGRRIFEASPGSIGVLSSKLLEDPSTKRYGEALKQAEADNDKAKKNATLFAAMQNPASRAIITKHSPEIKRQPANSDEARDEEYIQKRNRFIQQQETGSEASEKDEFSVYKDSGGKRTIGHGFNLDAPGQYEMMKRTLELSDKQASDIYSGKKTLSAEQAESLLNLSTGKAETQLNKKLETVGSPKLSANQRVALTSMIYNSPKLVGPKILKALQSGDYDEVARLISVTSDWQADQHPGLPTRRRKEAELFSKPEEEPEQE